MAGKGRKIIDISGQKFGRLTVLSYSHTHKHCVRWWCLCDCGNKIVARGQHLKSGNVKSCGCIRKECWHTEETKRKIGESNSMSHKGMKYSEEAKRNMSNSKAGERHWNWGGKASEESRRKMSEAQSGEKSHSWRGGLSYERYPLAFNRRLKRNIRDRDNHVCQECGISEHDSGRRLQIHHIDYNKLNCDPNNLVSLCVNCHAKTGFNRDRWTEYYLSKFKVFNVDHKS